MLPAAVADVHPAHEAALEPVTLRHAPRLLRILAPIAMLGILCVILQGSAATWSAIYLADVLLQPQGIAALAYVVYMGAMVVGRLTNDRWVDRWGERRIIRVGAAVGAAGVLAVIASGPLGQPLLAFAGFAGVGLGSSPMFPVMVGVAGSRPGIPAGHGVALVAWMVRFGLVFAPAAVGLAGGRPRPGRGIRDPARGRGRHRASGGAAHRRAAATSACRGLELGGRLAGLREHGVAARHRRHALPRVADLHLDGERDRQRQGALHRLAKDRDQAVDLVARRLDQQLVVHREHQPGPEPAGAQRLVGADHRDLHDVGGRALDRHVDRHPLAGGLERAVRGRSSGIWRFRPRSVET